MASYDDIWQHRSGSPSRGHNWIKIIHVNKNIWLWTDLILNIIQYNYADGSDLDDGLAPNMPPAIETNTKHSFPTRISLGRQQLMALKTMTLDMSRSKTTRYLIEHFNDKGKNSSSLRTRYRVSEWLLCGYKDIEKALCFTWRQRCNNPIIFTQRPDASAEKPPWSLYQATKSYHIYGFTS